MIQLELDSQYVLKVFPNDMTDEQFLQFCLANKHVRIERDKDRNITIMPPVTYDSGNRESEIATDVKIWARKNGGDAPSPSTGFA